MILNLSGGTKYELYFDEISKIITDATMQFIRTNNKSDVDEFILYELVHILVSSYIKGILVPLSQNMNLDEANIYIQHVKKILLCWMERFAENIRFGEEKCLNYTKNYLNMFLKGKYLHTVRCC